MGDRLERAGHQHAERERAERDVRGEERMREAGVPAVGHPASTGPERKETRPDSDGGDDAVATPKTGRDELERLEEDGGGGWGG
jgi:hypothetical protein